jgi:hypothetical protein
LLIVLLPLYFPLPGTRRKGIKINAGPAIQLNHVEIRFGFEDPT